MIDYSNLKYVEGSGWTDDDGKTFLEFSVQHPHSSEQPLPEMKTFLVNDIPLTAADDFTANEIANGRLTVYACDKDDNKV